MKLTIKKIEVEISLEELDKIDKIQNPSSHFESKYNNLINAILKHPGMAELLGLASIKNPELKNISSIIIDKGDKVIVEKAEGEFEHLKGKEGVVREMDGKFKAKVNINGTIYVIPTMDLAKLEG